MEQSELHFCPTQADGVAFGLNLQDLDVNDITAIQDCAKRDLTFVQQPVLFDTDIDEGPKINYQTAQR